MVKPSFHLPVDESDLFPDDAPAATGAQTRTEYIRRGSSGYTKVRNRLVQTPRSNDVGRSQPAMLPAFARNHRAAVLYLALLTNWTWLSRGEGALAADAWIRFLTSDAKGALTWTPQSLSHAWGVLEDLQLVSRSTVKRLRKVTPCHESGSGQAYTSPDGKAADTYFVLPAAFWTEDYFATLSWPALAVLLILLKETGRSPAAELAIDRAEQQYGLSRTSAEKGLAELRKRELIRSKSRWVTDFEAAEGRRLTSLHALVGPFSLAERRELQAAARTRRGGTHPTKEVNDDDEAQET